MRSAGVLTLTLAVVLGSAAAVQAANIGVDAKKLIVLDKLTKAGKAKVVYVSKDQANGITKGTGTDTGDIEVTFDFAYGNGATSGTFDVPTGTLSGDTGWKVNKDTVAKFVNKAVPAVTGVKVAVIKPGKLLKIVGKNLGDSPIDIFAAGDPAGSVFTAFRVRNGADDNTHCTEFTSCSYKLIAGDTGAKLVCKSPNSPDPGCTAATPPALFTYSVTTEPGGGSCGETRDDAGGGGALIKSLTCGGLNIGAGAATVPEGPTPDGATNTFNAACVGDACSLSAATAGDTGSNNDCTDVGCKFGTYLSIANGPLSNCVDNSFQVAGSGSLDTSTGEVSANIPLLSVVTVTGNNAEPCPPCSGAPGVGVCDASAANPGAACTGVNASGDSYDCDPAGSTLPGFSVDLSPAQTQTVTASDAGGIFCPGQATAGCFQGGGACRYIEANGAPAGAVTAGVPHNLTLASVFCIPKTGNALVDGAANLPGPGEVTLPMEGLLN